MLQEELLKRVIPDYFTFLDGRKVETIEAWNIRRMEMKELLRHNFCGYAPSFDTKVTGVVKNTDENAFGSKGILSRINIQIQILNQYFSFPCNLIIPKHADNAPVFLYLSFSSGLVDELLPVEEIIDQGFAIASFYYQDVVPDKEDGFVNGMARIVTRNPYDSWGKISMWSWAASRVMDYLQTLKTINKERIAIIGHSRLGKTALWCGANDERFSLVVSNDSGAGGAALFRGKTGEKIENLVGTPSYWFCGNFKQYSRREMELPFDQHFILSLVAPRSLYVCSAEDDDWSDPKSEFLCCIAANKAYQLYGIEGLVSQDKYPKVNQVLDGGNIGYHMRKGSHFLSRYDWQKVMDYRNMDTHRC